MQYAVFVYASSAQAVKQDLFLFFFKTKTVSGANTNKPREKRAPYYGGKKNQQTNTVSRANTLLGGKAKKTKRKSSAK